MINYIEFINSSRTLKINQNVLKIFAKYEQKIDGLEAGGILLGNVLADYDEIIKASVPNRFDTRDYFFFNRAKIPAQLKINKEWEKSNGTMIYLGEWHTHSEVNPKPSVEDKKMILKVFQETIMEINFLYLIIVGPNGTYWVGRQTANGLIELDKK